MIFLGFAENSIQLVPDGTLFLHIAIILLMVFILNATLFKPINRILEERERRTRGRSSEAQDILRDVENNLTSYERSVREARTEGYKLLEQERAAEMSVRQTRLSAVREDEKNGINAQAKEARATLEEDARRLASEISSSVLNRPVSNTSVGTRT